MTTDTIDQIAAGAWERTHRQTRYLSCAETAKLIRAALKREFPGVKFTVKSHVYAGGASIDVKWTDGPLSKAVDNVVGVYAGGRFDGSIDLKYGVTHFLRSDGSLFIARNSGSAGSGGYDAGEDNRDLMLMLPDDVELVHLGADFVFCSREISDRDNKIADALEYIKAHCVLEREGRMFGNRWIDDLATSMVYMQLTGEDWSIPFARVMDPFTFNADGTRR